MDDKINLTEADKNPQKRRVLFVITQSELGGAQRFLAYLINNLDESHFETIIATGVEGEKEIKSWLSSKLRVITLKNLHRNPNIFSDIASVFELKKQILELNPDTLFLLSSKAGFIGSIAARLLQTTHYPLQTIYRIGGWSFNDPRAWWKNLFYRWLEKLSAPWKDYIIVNSKHDYDQAVKHKIKPQRDIVLIHNGVEPYKLEFLGRDEAKIRLYEKLPSDQKHANFLHKGLVMGTIANFYKTKGLQYLIDAFRILTHNLKPMTCNLVLIGDGPESGNLKFKIENLKLNDKVIFTGRIPDAHKYLPAFDVFVLPSVKEGFPWVMLEAMSAKLPIVATSVGADPEIIENEKNGLLVPPHDPQAIAEAVSRLAGDERLRRELGIQAHQTVLHKFSLAKMVETVEKLL